MNEVNDRRSATELRLEGVVFAPHGEVILGPLDFALRLGTPCAITGPSGAGKTVLCFILAGVLRPTSGQVLFGGLPLDSDRVNIGFALQTHGLVAGLTAAENVAIPLQARRFDRKETARRTASALASVGLAAELDRQVDELSGGECQRVGVARALAGDPQILIADEPTAELDEKNQSLVMDLLTGPSIRPRAVVVACDDPEILKRFSHVVELSTRRVEDRSV